MTATDTATKTPIKRVLELLPDAKPKGEWYNVACPSHPDHETSFGFKESDSGGVIFHCFAGCNRENILSSLTLTENDVQGTNGHKVNRRSQAAITLWDLGVDKRINPNFLMNLGIVDGYTWHTPKGKIYKNVVRVPYYLENGKEHTKIRIRTTPTAKTGSFWEGPGDVPLMPYGLDRLDQAREAGYVVIPEGESDCWTSWLHNVPALGAPGATEEKTLHGDMLKGIERAYIIQETDKAGSEFPKRVAERLTETGYQGQCYAVSLGSSHGVKDLNALHQKLHSEGRVKAFRDELQMARDAAILIELHTDTSEAQATLASLQPLVLDAIEKQDVNALYDLAEKIAALPTRDKIEITGSIKSGMSRCDTFSWSSFKTLIQEAGKEHKQRAHAERVYVTGKPEVLLGRQLHEEVDDSLDALYKANHPPVIYIRGGKLVRCRMSEKDKPLIEMMDERSIIERLTRVAEFVTYNEETDTYSSVHPTAKIAQTILAQPGWKFPPLEGVIEVPIVRPGDGTILDEPGYDAATRLLYIPQPGLVIPPIPVQPTQKQLNEARRFAFSFIQEFPYVGDADKTNACGLELTAVTRSLYGLVPAAVIDATKPGTGKGLLSKLVTSLSTGRSCASTTMPDTEEEWAKTLTGLLLEGSTVISIDNVEKVLNSSKLASFLTADLWKQRVLGSNATPELPQRCIVMANGNNVALGGDIPRRCFRIRMDAGVSQPWKREGFTYNPLMAHVAQNRGKIIAALLTMTRAWYAAGCPVSTEKTPSIGEFDEWARIIGGILSYAGINGFLANNDALYEEADAEGSAWEAFLTAWSGLFKSREITIAELVDTLTKDQAFADTLPDGLSSAMLNPNKSFNRALSHTLRKKKDTPFGPDNLKLSSGKPDGHAKVATWKVLCGVKQNLTPQSEATSQAHSDNDAGLAGSDLPQRESSTLFSATNDNEQEKEKNKEENKKVHNSEEGKVTPPNTANPANSSSHTDKDVPMHITPDTAYNYPYDVIAVMKKHGMVQPDRGCIPSNYKHRNWLPFYSAGEWIYQCGDCNPALRSTKGRHKFFE